MNISSKLKEIIPNIDSIISTTGKISSMSGDELTKFIQELKQVEKDLLNKEAHADAKLQSLKTQKEELQQELKTKYNVSTVDELNVLKQSIVDELSVIEKELSDKLLSIEQEPVKEMF